MNKSRMQNIVENNIIAALRNTMPEVWPAKPINPNESFKWQARLGVHPQPHESQVISRINEDEGFWVGFPLPTFDGMIPIRKITPPHQIGEVVPSKNVLGFDAGYDLRIMDVYAHRYQNITAASAMAEGIGHPLYEHPNGFIGPCMADITNGCGSCANCDPVSHYRDSLKWLQNPSHYLDWQNNVWVWVFEFMRGEMK